jgi:hypothetical protein
MPGYMKIEYEQEEFWLQSQHEWEKALKPEIYWKKMELNKLEV